MPTNNLATKSKNKLGIASSIPPNMAERFGAAVSPYLQGAQALFPPANPYGQVVSNFLLGRAPQAAQQMAAGYPNVLFDTRNPLGGNRIVNPVALDMALALPVATAVKGAGMAGGGVAATFAGARAQTANRAALALAEKMKAAGVADEEIHKATGWFFGSADGKPRFEIDDSGAMVKNLPINKSWDEYRSAAEKQIYGRRGAQPSKMNAKEFKEYKKQIAEIGGQYNTMNRTMRPVEDIYQHPSVYKEYPELSNLSAQHRPELGQGGSYNSGKIEFGNVDNPEGVKGLFGHELQHAIQQREGFARGGSTSQFTDYTGALERAQQNGGFDPVTGDSDFVIKLAIKERGTDPYNAYRRLAGESEARLTQSRMDMTGPERAASYPPNMYDVPVGDQIVRYGEGDAMSVPSMTEGELRHQTAQRNAAIAAAMGVAAPNLLAGEQQSPESQAIARYREVKGPKSVVRMEAALRTAGVPLPKNEPVAYIQRLVDQAHRRN